MNVLVYVVDCLRSDRLTCYGYSRETTPNIDAVAEDGIRYTQCFAPATWTRPVSVSVLTGAYPPTHGVRHRDNTFPSKLKRLPQYLSEAGFETVGVSTMGNVSSTLGYDVGFDRYFDLYKNDDIVRKRRRASTDREKLLHEKRNEIALPRAEDINEYVNPVIEQSDDDLFVFCWGIDLHMPLDPPESHREFLASDYQGPIDGTFDSLPDEYTNADIERLKNLYDCELRYTDDQFGKLIEKLKEESEYDESLIIVLGDHGEAFNEHEHLFHGATPHDEVLHVPLVVKPPAKTTVSNDKIDDLVSLIDVCPTILDITDADAPAKYVQGNVVAPFGAGDSDRSVFAETQIRDFKPAHYAIRTDRWKYIEIRRPSLRQVFKRMYDQREELPRKISALATLRNAIRDEFSNSTDRFLYDIVDDPEEQINLASERTEVAEQFEQRISDWLADCGQLNDDIADSAERDIDSGTMKQLKQLGYTD